MEIILGSWIKYSLIIFFNFKRIILKKHCLWSQHFEKYRLWWLRINKTCYGSEGCRGKWQAFEQKLIYAQGLCKPSNDKHSVGFTETM